MSRSRVWQWTVIVACAAGMAACSSGHPGHQAVVSSSGPSKPVVMAPAKGQHYQASIALAGQPEVTANGKDIVVTVHVTNTGTGIFGSASTPHPVNIGARSIDAAGKIVNNNLARGHLPQVAPGATVTATIVMPALQLIGKRAEILPVEEAVSWFDLWPTDPTQPLVVGPFEACASAAVGKICGPAGKPLPVAAMP